MSKEKYWATADDDIDDIVVWEMEPRCVDNYWLHHISHSRLKTTMFIPLKARRSIKKRFYGKKVSKRICEVWADDFMPLKRKDK